MRAVAMPVADPRLEFHWPPDPGLLIQGFPIHGPRRAVGHLQAKSWSPARLRASSGVPGAVGTPDQRGRCEILRDFGHGVWRSPAKSEA